MSKLLLVTGGSRGIGAATCIAAAQAGWHVIVNFRSAISEAETVVKTIIANGGRADLLAGDVSNETDVVNMFATIRNRHGRLDGLVNNAGILPLVGAFEDIELERWNRTFAINTAGTFLCCREAVKMMAPRFGGNGGVICNVTSMAATLGGAGEFIDYGASKGAVETLTIGLSKELGADGIRVNGVRPGLIATDIHESAGDIGRVDRLAKGVPLGRAGTANETAAAIVWLLSAEASYVSGTTIAVSGGR